MNDVTLEHIRQAAEWAKTARDAPQPIDGFTRQYSQDVWDCGTACCIWGAANILAGNGPADVGPLRSWDDWGQDEQRTAIADLLGDATTTPERVLVELDWMSETKS